MGETYATVVEAFREFLATVERSHLAWFPADSEIKVRMTSDPDKFDTEEAEFFIKLTRDGEVIMTKIEGYHS